MKEKFKQSFKNHHESHFQQKWDVIINQLKSDETDNKLWLQCPSGYLLKTEKVLWGVDLAFLNDNIFSLLNHRLKEDLETLKFIIITHEHADHFDAKLLKLLKELPSKWVVPDFLKDRVIEATGVCEQKVVAISAGQSLQIDEKINITAFEGLHWQPNTEFGCDALGFFIDTGKNKLLFPGDVREYAPSKMPKFDDVDYLFSHVWLGRDNALNYPWVEYLEPFCKFADATGAKNVLLTHLYETSRDLNNMWTYTHCGAVIDELTSYNREREIIVPQFGKMYSL